MHRVLLAAGLSALAGAIVWGAITYYTGYEIGYVAWGIGLLVGGAAVAVGGEGKQVGVVCAALALGSILAGKMLAVQYAAPAEIRKMMEVVLTAQLYEEEKKDAADFAALTAEDQYADFMVSHGYTDAGTSAEVTQEEKKEFAEYDKPNLEKLHREQPNYDQWREGHVALATSSVTSGPVFESVVNNLNAIDLIFALLGLGTAYQIPARKGQA